MKRVFQHYEEIDCLLYIIFHLCIVSLKEHSLCRQAASFITVYLITKEKTNIFYMVRAQIRPESHAPVFAARW